MPVSILFSHVFRKLVSPPNWQTYRIDGHVPEALYKVVKEIYNKNEIESKNSFSTFAITKITWTNFPTQQKYMLVSWFGTGFHCG